MAALQYRLMCTISAIATFYLLHVCSHLCQGGDERAGAWPEQDLHGPSGGGGAGAELSHVKGPKSCNATGAAEESQQEPAASDKDAEATV